MEKTLRAIAQAKDNGESVQYYIRDLNSWENEMKQKEAALKEEQAEQVLPPVRTKQRRDKAKKKNNKLLLAVADQTVEVFDPTKAYDKMENVGPLSLTLDLKHSEIFKQMQTKEEAQYQKEKGNKFVKVERWDDAIVCYNRAIQLVKDDAIYYANRGLCYLKKESLHQAEQDCTEALRLDPKYVKALQRRATARERLGSLRAATADLTEVIKLEPNNTAAKRQLESIKQRMGTKGRKAKSSPMTKSSHGGAADLPGKLATQSGGKPVPQGSQSKLDGQEASRHTAPQGPQGKIFGVPQASQIELDIKPTPIKKVQVDNGSSIANWKEGVGEDVLVIKPVKRPPHLRSRRTMKSIPIREIPIGKTIDDLQNRAPWNKLDEGDLSEDDGNDDDETDNTTVEKDMETNDDSVKDIINGEHNNMKNDETNVKNDTDVLKVSKKNNMVAPTNSVQFMSEWRNLRGDDSARSDYLSLLEPSKIPMVFANALESAVLSEILQVLHEHREGLRPRVAQYLRGLAGVKRLSALVMFLSAADKDLLNKLLVHCKTAEDCTDEQISELKKKYEL